MFCRISDDKLTPRRPGDLGERLRALPSFEPPRGGWERLERRLDAPRRYTLLAGGGLALAASILLAVALVPAGMPPRGSMPAPAATVASADPGTTQLIKVSQSLEGRLARLRPQVTVWDSARAERAAEIEQRITLVDLQLNYAEPATAQRLWRDRVELMSALVELHQSPSPALQYASYQY